MYCPSTSSASSNTGVFHWLPGKGKVYSQREGSIKVDVCQACAGVWIDCEANAMVYAVPVHTLSAWSWNVHHAAMLE